MAGSNPVQSVVKTKGNMKKAGIGLVILAILIALGFWIWGGSSKKQHKATCWKPSYASAPTATWAKNPSATHRHGAGVRGKDVCDGK